MTIAAASGTTGLASHVRLIHASTALLSIRAASVSGARLAQVPARCASSHCRCSSGRVAIHGYVRASPARWEVPNRALMATMLPSGWNPGVPSISTYRSVKRLIRLLTFVPADTGAVGSGASSIRLFLAANPVSQP